MRESPWIEWEGGNECPIPFAKAGEFEVTFRSGCNYKPLCTIAKDILWGNNYGAATIVKYRLTDGWLPVLNGVCPIPPDFDGNWEYKTRDGHAFKAIGLLCNFANPKDIVAVRIVEEAPVVVQQPPLATHCHYCDVEVDNEDGYRCDVCCDVCAENFEYIAGPLNNGPDIPVVPSRPETPETERHRLTREAYQRYKAKHPTPESFYTLGENGIKNLFYAAMRKDK